MKCFFYKGKMVDGVTTYMEEVNGHYIIIKHVPCHQCEQCGEVSYSGETVVKIERIINDSNFAHPKQACNNAQQGNVTP